MPKKLDILRLFEGESLTPFDLAYFLDIEPNYARQIILRLKRQGLIFPHPTFVGGQAYSLTGKGEARIIYLADKEKEEAERRKKEAIEEKKRSGMSLDEVIAEGVARDVEKRIRSEFNITSIRWLRSKSLNEIALPQEIWEKTGLLKVRRERKLGYLELPFVAWIRVLENISKPAPKPQHLSRAPEAQHLSLEEVLLLDALTKREKGEFLVTKDGEVLYAPRKGYLTMGAAAIPGEYRKSKRAR